MSELVSRTVDDLRCGRSTWRVLLLLSLPALAAGIAVGAGAPF
jgi:hypothetical protein